MVGYFWRWDLMVSINDLIPINYPSIWANIATDKDNQPGKWTDDTEYFQLWDEGWKYQWMMQYRYDKDLYIIWSLKPKSSSKYIHIYAEVGVIGEDVNITQMKIMGKSDKMPVWDEYGYPQNGIAHRISNHRWMYNTQYGDRYYLGKKTDMDDVKWDVLYIGIWDCWESMDNIEQI